MKILRIAILSAQLISPNIAFSIARATPSTYKQCSQNDINGSLNFLNTVESVSGDFTQTTKIKKKKPRTRTNKSLTPPNHRLVTKQYGTFISIKPNKIYMEYHKPHPMGILVEGRKVKIHDFRNNEINRVALPLGMPSLLPQSEDVLRKNVDKCLANEYSVIINLKNKGKLPNSELKLQKSPWRLQEINIQENRGVTAKLYNFKNQNDIKQRYQDIKNNIFNNKRRETS